MLHRLWWWALKYAESGVLSKYDCSQFLVRLTDRLKSDELLKVLIECKFIENDADKIKIHDWWDYAGRYLTGKYRTGNPRKLKQIQRLYKSVKSRTKVRLLSAHLTLPNHTLPDNPPIPPTAQTSFEQFWFSYPLKVSKKKAFEIWAKLNPPEELLGKILKAIEDQKASREKLLSEKKFCPEWPHPTTWLNQERWNDVMEVQEDDPFRNLRKKYGKAEQCIPAQAEPGKG